MRKFFADFWHYMRAYKHLPLIERIATAWHFAGGAL